MVCDHGTLDGRPVDGPPGVWLVCCDGGHYYPMRVIDCDANVGPLLEMLQRYDQHVMLECYPGSHWECQRWDDPSEEWISEEGPTPCQALCLAILALPPASDTSADGSPDTA